MRQSRTSLLRTLVGVLVLSSGLLTVAAARPGPSLAAERPQCYMLGAGTTPPASPFLSMWLTASGCGINAPDWRSRARLVAPDGSLYREWTLTGDQILANPNGELVNTTLTLPVGGPWTFLVEDWYSDGAGVQYHGLYSHTSPVNGGVAITPPPPPPPPAPLPTDPPAAPTPPPVVGPTPRPTVAPPPKVTPVPSVSPTVAPTVAVSLAPSAAPATPTPAATTCLVGSGCAVAGATSLAPSARPTTAPSAAPSAPTDATPAAGSGAAVAVIAPGLALLALFGSWLLLLLRRRRRRP